ncbi:MAG: T9SS type A sorting domain-containing protein [Candidatus Cloacimonetes bacterium]|nr:T9SS type A sorting domain-containing protein [Candidatus Cloacimonadota bacterium]
MKKLIFVAILLLLALYLTGDQRIAASGAENSISTRQTGNSREIITIYSENFENGAADWEHYDETAPTDWNEAWHLSTTGAYAGNSWWMGDEVLGGYTSHRYLVLDTPQLTLSSTPELNFMCHLNCEDPGPSPPYDAWDGANVRISTDGGATWEVIAGTPVYNGTSFYSFGYEFNEGEGIPGWGGTNLFHNWTAASFDLSTYANQEVKIRFAFASDPAYDTFDDPDMFGFKVDNIQIDTATGLFISDGDGAAGDAQMVPGYGGETAGDLWHIYEETTAPSPTHAMGCFDTDTDTYLPGMSDFIVSPIIALPEEGVLRWDVYCETLLDTGTFPDCDYIHVEVRSQIPGENWLAWTSISNPLYDPNGNNYVFTGSIDTWTSFTDGWGLEYADLSMLAGRNVQFRFGLHSNMSDEVVPGGFRIDNFFIEQEFFQGPGPENLVAEVSGSQVDLSWDAIVEGGSEGWIQWDDGVNDNSIGLTDGGTLYAAARFDAADLMPYVGGEITQMEIYISEMPDDMVLHIWEGYLAGNELMSQAYVPTADSWNLINLDTPIVIGSMSEYWIGYEVTNDDTAHSAGTDIGPAVQGKGDFIATSPGAWNELYTYDLDYNWNIHAYVDAGGRRLPLFAVNNREREITGYNVWRSDTTGENYELIGSVATEEYPTYTDTDPVLGGWNYYVVTALYDDVDGEYSNEAAAFVLSGDMLELYYDDGSAEEGLNVGITQYMAVRFEPVYEGPVQLTHIRMYIETMNTGQFVFRIFTDNGGVPSTTYLAQFVVTAANLNPGWNTIAIPEAYLETLIFTEGSYYVAVFEMANTGAIGKDTDTSGNSLITSGGVWQSVTDGNIMLRSILFYQEGLYTYGDVDSNGVIDAYDASLVLMNAVGMVTPVEPFPEIVADVDGNGNVEAYDAALILQFVVGLINVFPVELREYDIPTAELGYRLEGRELVITARGELYSAELEFPFAIRNETINEAFISRINRNKVAMASAIPVNGEIMRLAVDPAEINGTVIFTLANNIRGELRIGESVRRAEIKSAYPNPFNPETTIFYSVPQSGAVDIEIYNAKGQKVETLLSEEMPAGDYQMTWKANGMASGIYFVRMNCAGDKVQYKLMLLK